MVQNRSNYTWYLDGLKIKAIYLEKFPVQGTVIESRVKYGGSIQHQVKLDEPFNCDNNRCTLLIDEEELVEILE